jgi:hypothetical protein
LFVDGMTASAAPMVAVSGTELGVDAVEAFEQGLSAGGKVQELSVDLAELVADVVFFREEALVAGVGNGGFAAEGDQVAAVDIGSAGDGLGLRVVGGLGCHGGPHGCLVKWLCGHS